MKFNRYNTEIIKAWSTRGKPLLSVTHRGLFRFSVTLSNRLQLNESSKIELLQSKEDPEDWYVVTDSPVGFGFRNGKSDLGKIFSSKALYLELSKVFKIDAPIFNMIVSTESILIDGMKAYQIIKKSVKPK